MNAKHGKAVAGNGVTGASPRKERQKLPVDKKSIPGSVRLTPARWAKLRRLGSAWLSRAIDRARELDAS